MDWVSSQPGNRTLSAIPSDVARFSRLRRSGPSPAMSSITSGNGSAISAKAAIRTSNPFSGASRPAAATRGGLSRATGGGFLQHARLQGQLPRVRADGEDDVGPGEHESLEHTQDPRLQTLAVE